MKAIDITEVSEIKLYYGGKREERQIVTGYINIDRPLRCSKTAKHYIVKMFHGHNSFWALINEERMEKYMTNCICIKKACYQIDKDKMKRIETNLMLRHGIVELNLFE